MSDDQNPESRQPESQQIANPEPRRDAHGRFVKGGSGNPAGRPVGIMSEAARVAAAMLNARAPELVAAAIERALAGRDAPLKYCLDRIIAPQKDQPIVWEEAPPEGEPMTFAEATRAITTPI